MYIHTIWGPSSVPEELPEPEVLSEELLGPEELPELEEPPEPAEGAGISVVYLSKIENGRVYPTLETLSNLCTELDTELSAILSNTEVARKDYANDRVLELFNACSIRVKPIARSLLEELSKL